MTTKQTTVIGMAVAGVLAITVSASATDITNMTLTPVPVPVEVLLLDFGSDTSYRGLSVPNPDGNGNYWNSLQPGIYYTNLIAASGNATTIDLGFTTSVGTDSYNGPAGPVSDATYTTDVTNTVIDAEALGILGVTNAVFDFMEWSPLNFNIQGLDPARRYNLTFFGSHIHNSDATTVYSVYTDNTYSTVVDSVSLDIHQPGTPWIHNSNTVATISGLAPQTTNNFLYVQVGGSLGGSGYLNCMMIEATTPEAGAEIVWESTSNSVYDVEEATDLVASNWTDVISGLVATGSSMSATVLLDSDSAAFRIVEQPTLFSDDFESGTNGWTTGTNNAPTTVWGLGPPANVGPSGANSPSNCWGTNIDSYYNSNANSWLRSPPIDLTSASTALLNWQQALDIEDGGVPYDWGEVNILDTNNVPILSLLGGKISGEDAAPAWTLETLSLDGAVGNVIKIEFRFKSDSFNAGSFAGWYIDDVQVSAQ